MSSYRLPLQRLVIEVWSDNSSTHGPQTLKSVIHDAARIGWSQYSRFPSNAFFTLRQNSVHNAAIVPGLDHIRIYYVNDKVGYGPVLVFNGRIGDPSESGDDVVWTAWSYLAELALSRTGYQVYYKSKQIADVVTDEWSRNAASGKFHQYGAKVRGDSLLGHIATGAIQNPKAEDGTHEMVTDPAFGVIDTPRLLLFYDLTEIGRANTTQNVTMGITRSTTPTFRFLRDAGSFVTGQQLLYPGIIKDFRFVPGVLDIRNDLATIGTKKGKNVEMTAEVTTGTYGINLFGRRQDTFTIKTLSGYPKLGKDASKSSAQSSITKRAVKEASQPTKAIQLDVRADLFLPFNGWDIEDTIKVAIKTGRTALSSTYRLIGIRGVLDGTGYHQLVYVTLPTA